MDQNLPISKTFAFKLLYVDKIERKPSSSKRKLDSIEKSEFSSKLIQIFQTHESIDYKNEMIQHQEELKVYYEELDKNSTKQEPESGLHSDDYAACVFSSRIALDQVNEHRKNVVNQSPGDQSLQTVWPNSQIVSDVSLEFLKTNSDTHTPRTSLWLHVNLLPDLEKDDSEKAFKYTGAIMTNNLYEGLLHSFVRHWDQWKERIPELADLMVELSPILKDLKRIKNAPNRKLAEIAIGKLINGILKSLDKEKFDDVYCALLKAQLHLHQFIQDRISWKNFDYEGVNLQSNIMVNFKVKDNDEVVRNVMVVSVSKNLYPANDQYHDKRPVRKIMAVYFITLEDHLKKVNHFMDDYDENEVSLSNGSKKKTFGDYKDMTKKNPNDKDNTPRKLMKISETQLSKVNSSNNTGSNQEKNPGPDRNLASEEDENEKIFTEPVQNWLHVSFTSLYVIGIILSLIFQVF